MSETTNKYYTYFIKILCVFKQNGYSIYDIAKVAELNPSTIYRILYNKHSPNSTTIEKMEIALAKALPDEVVNL